MNRQAIFQTLHDHIVQDILLCPESLNGSDDLFDAGFDSMSLSRVLVFVEEQFNLFIPDEEVVLDDIATLDAMTAFIAARMSSA